MEPSPGPNDDYSLRPALGHLQDELRLELAEVHRKLDSLLDRLGERDARAKVKPEPSPKHSPSPRFGGAMSLSSYSDTTSLPALGAVLSPSPRRSKLHRCFQRSAGSTCLEVLPTVQTEGPAGRRNDLGGVSSLKEVQKAALLFRFRRRGLKVFQRIWDTLEDPDSGAAARYCATLMPLFIIATVCSSLLQPLLPAFPAGVAETAVDSVYLLEFIVRFLVYPNQWTFFADVYNMIDLAAAVPLPVRASMGFVLPPGEVRTWQHGVICCGVPMVRLLKLLRRFEKFHLLLRAFELAAEALPVLLFILSAIWLFFAMLIYLIEDRGTIPTVGTAAWFTIVTMTTVGYGDVTPQSSAGSVIAGCLVIVTVLYMAIPLGIVGNAFTQTWNERDRILLMQKTHDRLKQWGYTAHDIPELFRLSDVDDKGRLDIAEFRDLLHCMQIGFSDERIFQLFRLFDLDRSGVVDDREFVRVLFPNSYHEIYYPRGTRGGVEHDTAQAGRQP